MKLDTPEKIKKFLSENPKTKYTDNDGKHYSLKDNQLIVIEPNHYHSLEYVKK